VNTSLWILGFIVVLAVTVAQTAPRRRPRKETCMEKIDCSKLLSQLKPPLLSLKRGDYRPHVTAWVADLDMEQVRALCAFFRCDISSVVTRIMDWQYARARWAHQDARARARKDKCHDATA
jgi:hypothetical protein